MGAACTLGILLVQDLAVVPLVVVLPALATGGEALLQDLGLTALKAGGVLAGAYLIAYWWQYGRDLL